MVDCCRNPQQHHQVVFDKYSDRRYKRASEFVQTEMDKGYVLPGHQHSYVRPAMLPAPPQAAIAPRFIEVGS